MASAHFSLSTCSLGTIFRRTPDAALSDDRWPELSHRCLPSRSGRTPAPGPSASDGGHPLPGSGRDSLAGSAESFGPWQTIWKHHRRFSADQTWDEILRRLLGDAESAGPIATRHNKFAQNNCGGVVLRAIIIVWLRTIMNMR